MPGPTRSPTDPGSLTELQQDLRPRLAGFVFAMAALAAAGCAVLLALPGARLQGAELAALLMAELLLCAVSLHARRCPHGVLDAAVCRVSLAALAPIALMAWLVDGGLQGAGGGFLAVLLCLSGALASRRTAVLVGALAAALVGALAWGQWSGALPAHPRQPLALQLGLQALVLLTAAAGGRLLNGVLLQYQRQGAQRAAAEAARALAQRQLEQALDQAQAASRAKSAFLANTSHELRTPLNALVGLAQLARATGLAEDKRQQYLTQMLDSADTLMGVISDILDLSKVEAGKLDIHPQDFDLHALLQRLQRGYAAIAATHGLELVLHLVPELPAGVHGDPVRLRQVLGNYLSNALKFTEQGKVRLSAWPTGGGRIRFEVEDTGPGLDAATQARLFRPFIQADDSVTRRHGGTGLGLSICRELAQLMDGTVGVSSALGRGSRFWFELPLPTAAAPVQPAVPAPAPSAQALAGVRVLMVEDNLINMTISTAMLQQWGAQVTGAADGLEALQAVERAQQENRPFQAVLMDMQMPRMGGREATRELRRRFDADTLPIVALTAAALPAERDEALAAGMNDFLTKPIDANKLLATLQRVIRV